MRQGVALRPPRLACMARVNYGCSLLLALGRSYIAPIFCKTAGPAAEARQPGHLHKVDRRHVWNGLAIRIQQHVQRHAVPPQLVYVQQRRQDVLRQRQRTSCCNKRLQEQQLGSSGNGGEPPPALLGAMQAPWHRANALSHQQRLFSTAAACTPAHLGVAVQDEHLVDVFIAGRRLDDGRRVEVQHADHRFCGIQEGLNIE